MSQQAAKRPHDHDAAAKASLTQRLARVSALHPWRIVAAWGLILAASIVAIGALIGSAFSSDASLTTTPDSTRAEQVLADNFSQGDRIDDAVVIYSAQLHHRQSGVQDVRHGRSVLDRGHRRSPDRAGPLRSQGEGRTSEDGHAAVVTLALGHDAETGMVDVLDAVDAADANAAFEVDITGANTLDHDFNKLSESDLTNGELKFGLPAAMIVLILVFGALVAAFLPMFIAILSIIVTVALSSVLGQFTSLSFFIVNMVTAMGLALGIDYSLFVLSRYREEQLPGRDKIAAIVATGGTSSKAVLFSGSSFVVALLGLLLVPDTILRSLALGAIIVGVVTMAAAITLLPALLSLLGDRVNALRLPIVGRDHPAESPFWTRAVRAVVRRPATWLAVGVLILLAAALPVLGLQTGSSGVNSLPDDTYAKSGVLALERSFPAPRPTILPRWSSPVTSSPRRWPRPSQSSRRPSLTTRTSAPPSGRSPTTARCPWSASRWWATPTTPRLAGGSTGYARPGSRCVQRDRSPGAGRGRHRRERRLLRRHQPLAAHRAHLRPRAELPAAHPGLPVPGPLRHRRDPQPAVGWRGLRLARPGLPGRRRGRPAGLPAGRKGRGVGAGVLVLGPVRPIDGLPRVPAQPDP